MISISKMEAKHLNEVVKLHRRLLPGFLSYLGSPAIHFFYSTALSIKGSFGWVGTINGKLAGFAFGSLCGSSIYRKVFIRKPLLGTLIIFLSIFHNIFWVIKTVRCFLNFRSKQYQWDQPELIFIGVDVPFQGVGLGKLLVRKVCEDLAQRGITSFQLSMDSHNEKTQRFYQSLGAKFLCSYNEGGMDRQRYIFYLQPQHTKI